MVRQARVKGARSSAPCDPHDAQRWGLWNKHWAAGGTWAGSRVTERDELMGRRSVSSRFPQYLMTAMLDAQVAVATFTLSPPCGPIITQRHFVPRMAPGTVAPGTSLQHPGLGGFCGCGKPHVPHGTGGTAGLNGWGRRSRMG